ncbi:hypothetical protein MKK64_16295 [Methylobacterium sp. E-025]|uniref:hypothetical protein n=1 Tax=Methylobacterium sp. E-025 TaxID=2836561 RepID=UPI001FBBC356|nr:hypothetical protein [Methylobacterium sp. E-025]MCJ2112747.1 hypothetical protein [Methylobacterium sp. E-025]
MSGTRQSFTVQTFRKKGQGVEPEETRSARDELHAIALADRLAPGCIGVVALRQDGDLEFGDVDEPVVLVVHGRVPPIFQELPF